MPRRTIERIREKVQSGQYDMTAHAMEEMAEDNLDILDVEQAILSGQVARIEKDKLKGTKYVIEGLAVDQQTLVGVVGRFTDTGRYLSGFRLKIAIHHVVQAYDIEDFYLKMRV